MRDFHPECPPPIPDYTLLRPIGRGAYGEVWLARSVMGTLRAIKIIWRRQFESDRPFEREFAGIQRYEPVSRTSGGLVHVLHVGRNEAEGYFYYVMELADPVDPTNSEIENYAPRTLRSDLKRLQRLSAAATLRLALDVVSGLSQLHRRGLVHRDVKPGNIIYVNDRAKLADIGLVSASGEGRTFVGTEGYIPPEGPGSAAADLYALGMVLYEASTGFSPEQFPDVPSDWFSAESGDDALELHEVVLKACEGQRERRYRDSDEMQADLALLQSGQSIRHMRALKKRYVRLRASLAAGVALLVCAMLALFLVNYRARIAAENHARESLLRKQAEEALVRTKAAERDARGQLYNALLEQARADVRSRELGQRVRALEAIRRAGALSNTVELRGAALAALALPDLQFEREWLLPPETTATKLDSTFQRLAVCRMQRPVEVYSVSDRQLLFSLPASTNLRAFAVWWSPDGRYLAVKRDRSPTENDAVLEVWDTQDQKRTLFLPELASDTISFHPTSPQVLAALPNGQIGIWDVQCAKQVAHFTVERSPEILAFSADGERFAASYVGRTNQVSIYNSSEGTVLATHILPDAANALEWHPRGNWLACGDGSGSIRLINPDMGAAQILGRHKMEAVLATFSPQGRYLISGGWERECICWDLKRMERAFTIPLASFRAQFSLDGHQCATITDEKIQFHTFEAPAACHEFGEDLGARLKEAVFSADGRWLAASASQRIGVWDLGQKRPVALLEEPDGARVFFANNGEFFASTKRGGLRWQIVESSNAPAHLEPLPLRNPPGFVSLCLASNQVILTTLRGSAVMPQDATDPNGLRWTPTAVGISGASPNNRWTGIFISFGNYLRIYELPGLRRLATLVATNKIAAFQFSPDSSEIAINSSRDVEIWSTEDWRRIQVLSNFVALIYLSGGTTGWLTKDFRSAGLYSLRTLEPFLPLPAGTLPIAVSPDGRYLAASLDGHYLQLWDLPAVREQLAKLGLDWQEKTLTN